MQEYEVIYKKVDEYLKKNMSEKRYNHTLGVVKVAEELASINNVDISKVKLAAILHDIVKEWTNDEINEFCQNNSLDFSYLNDYENVLHSHLGSKVAEINFNVIDEDILSAIKYHTTGRANMNKLEKIIYLADFLDPNRDIEKYRENFEKAKLYAYENLDKGMSFVLERTLIYLKDEKIYEDTRKAYEYYRVICDNN